MKAMHFEPERVSAKPGDLIEWKNEDIFAHTVTADDGSFDSGLIQPGASWSMTVKKDGTIAYHCRPHPNMKAAIAVGAGAMNEGGGEHFENPPKVAHGILPGFELPSSPQQIHPILVNFTAALVPLAFLSDLLGRLFGRRSFHAAGWWMILYAAAITPLTAAAGWWWKRNESPHMPPELIHIHQWLGTAAVFLFIGLALWRWSIHRREETPSGAYLLCAFIAVLALIYQGSLGGAMVFGG
jgi:uncharacterized membrane protein